MGISKNFPQLTANSKRYGIIEAKKPRRKKMGQIGMFDEENRLEKLSAMGDSLEKLNSVIHWEMFRPLINRAYKRTASRAGGRPPFDHVMMFKILVLQRVYNLSDDQTEYQINDRISFMRFLGLNMSDRIPDAKTIWLFRDTLTRSNIIRELFDLFGKQLEKEHLITRVGTIVDATFVEAPRQRNTREENAKIKEGEIPEGWEKDAPKTQHKCRQKDTDARWASKGGKRYYGYKNHIKADQESKLIEDYSVTAADVHDSTEIANLVNENDAVIYADSAYSGKTVAQKLPKTSELKICEKGYRYKPLTEEQRKNNHLKSKVRCRIEHIFGFMVGSMNGTSIRSIGRSRAAFNIGLTNLVYNMFRYELLRRNSVAVV